MAVLYVVGTPIGNLEDMSFRSVRILKEVGLIASEDTRTTRRLLSHFDIHTPLTSYFEHNKSTKSDYLLHRLEAADVALVSEAGMPGISDPGYEFIVAAAGRGFPVVAVPGPSAAVTALAVSGLPTDQFRYLGFLPRKQSERRRLLASVSGESVTLIAYEAPHRLDAALHDIIEVLGNRRLAVCRELTKLHEEVFRGAADEAVAHFNQPRGEFTLVVAGCRPGDVVAAAAEVIDRLRVLRQSGVTAREAVAQVCAVSGRPRKEIYKLWLEQENREHPAPP